MSGAICGTTESTAVPIGATFDPTGATFGTIGISCGAICALEIIGLRDVSVGIFVAIGVTSGAITAICAPTVATSAMTAEIFERATGKEEDRLNSNKEGRGSKPAAAVYSVTESSIHFKYSALPLSTPSVMHSGNS